MSETQEFYWLMERHLPAGELVYWDGGHAESFTADPWKATRWPTKDAAFQQCPAIHYAQWGWRVVEHGFGMGLVESATLPNAGATPTDTPVAVDAQNFHSSSLLSPVEGRQPHYGSNVTIRCVGCGVEVWQQALEWTTLKQMREAKCSDCWLAEFTKETK